MGCCASNEPKKAGAQPEQPRPSPQKKAVEGGEPRGLAKPDKKVKEPKESKPQAGDRNLDVQTERVAAERSGKRPRGRTRANFCGGRFQKEWPWSRPDPPADGVKARDYYYTKEYLSTFRILNAAEADAYQAWLKGDAELARSLLPGKEGRTPPGSPKPTGEKDVEVEFDSDDERDETKAKAAAAGRDRGGSVSAAIAQPQKGSFSKDPPALERHQSVFDPGEDEELLEIIRHCPLFAHLSTNFDEHAIVRRAMRKIRFKHRDKIYEKGQYPSDEVRGLYVVTKGSLLITKRSAKEHCGRGEFFGETIVMNATCKATFDAVVEDREGATCWLLDHESYSQCLSSIAYERRNNYKRRLREVKLADSMPFSGLPDSQLAQIADCLIEKTFRPGQKIISYGEPGKFAHFIVKGTVDVIGRNDGVPFRVCSFGAGEDPIGFLEFFAAENSPQAVCCADVVASGTVITACISREHFEKSLGPVKDFLKDAVDASEVYDYYRSQQKQL